MLAWVFTSHPKALGESYFSHQRAAFAYAGTLLVAGFAAAIHGLVPCLFETTASRAVARLHAHMGRRLDRKDVLF